MKTTLRAIYFIHAVIFSIIESGFSELTCLTCDDVALPSLCTKIDKCGPNELCGLEQYVTAIGSIRYKQKCIDKISCPRKHSTGRRADRTYRSSSSVICKSCCDEPLCNSGGCGLNAPDRSIKSRGMATVIGFEIHAPYKREGISPSKLYVNDQQADHLCYNCDTQIGHNMCNSIQQCGRDQICRIEPLMIPGAPKNLFRSGCVHKQSCATPSFIGRRRSACDTCCNGSLCNDYDPTKTCTHSMSSTTGSIAMSTTPIPTTPIPTVTSSLAAATITETTAQTTIKATQTTRGSQLVGGDCHDVQPKCLDTFCHLATYHDWAYANCRKSCGLCGGSASGTSGTAGPATTTSQTSTGGTGGTSTGSHIISGCTDKAAGCLADTHCNGSDYLQWAKEHCQKTCKFCIEHTSPIEKGDLYLMLKVVAGVKTPDIYELWKDSRTINKHVTAFADNKNTFHGHFKPDFSNHWAENAFDKVTLSMYNNGTEKVFITFNATGTDKFSWFDADRIINSTWAGDLTAGSNMAFEMQTNAATGFEFNAGDSTSCDSEGWMTIVKDDRCVQGSSLPFPAFLYCPKTSPCSWKKGEFVAVDVLELHAHATGLSGP